jgi:hypothetical protein
MDTPELLSTTLTMRSETLGDWATFDRIREMLTNLRMDFAPRQSR